MNSNSVRPLVMVWGALVCASLASWLIGSDTVSPWPLGDFAVVAFAAVKVYLVGAYFMELRHAPRWLHWGFSLWVLVVAAGILVMNHDIGAEGHARLASPKQSAGQGIDEPTI